MEKIEYIGIGISIILIISLSLYFGGVFNNEDTNHENISNEDNISDDDSSSEDLIVKIDYVGEFTSGYGSANKNDDFTATGPQIINLGNSNYVDIGARKSDGSSNMLKLSVLKGDKIVAEKITSDPYGEVIIHYSSSYNVSG